MINIDFLVAGCNTRCRHCYVNGGPGPMMPIEDVLLCIEKLDAIAAHLLDASSFTLDHEPMNHPHIDQILRAAAHTRHIQNYHHGMTTGVGLMHRKDKDAVMKAYLDCGYDVFGVTIHGNANHHDEIVRHKGAYGDSIAAAEYMRAQGARIEVSLMLNRFFTEDAEAITAMLEQLQPNYTGFVIPIFTPVRNILDFEPYRASVKTAEALRGYLNEWEQDESEAIAAAERNNIGSVTKRLKQGIDLQRLFAQEQDELYLTLHQNCKLFVGNSGAETRCLGDLRRIDSKAAAEIINGLPGNRDYGAYYDANILPSAGDLIKALEMLPQDAIYGDFESVLYRGLTELKIPTKIMN